jgi:hypothetical protein
VRADLRRKWGALLSPVYQRHPAPRARRAHASALTCTPPAPVPSQPRDTAEGAGQEHPQGPPAGGERVAPAWSAAVPGVEALRHPPVRSSHSHAPLPRDGGHRPAPTGGQQAWTDAREGAGPELRARARTGASSARRGAANRPDPRLTSLPSTVPFPAGRSPTSSSSGASSGPTPTRARSTPSSGSSRWTPTTASTPASRDGELERQAGSDSGPLPLPHARRREKKWILSDA